MIEYFKKIIYILDETYLKMLILLIAFILSSLIEVLGIGIAGLYVSVITGTYDISNVFLFDYFSFSQIQNNSGN